MSASRKKSLQNAAHVLMHVTIRQVEQQSSHERNQEECMASPVFSPIVKSKRNNSQETCEGGSDDNDDVKEDMEIVDKNDVKRMLSDDLTTGKLYQTAEIDCDDDIPGASHVSMKVDIQSGDLSLLL